MWLAGGHDILCMVRQPTQRVFVQMNLLQCASFLLGFSLFYLVDSRVASLSQTALIDIEVPVIGAEYWRLTYHPVKLNCLQKGSLISDLECIQDQ